MRITEVSKSAVAESTAAGDHPLLPVPSPADSDNPQADSAIDGNDVDETDADDATQATVTSVEACLLQSEAIQLANNKTPTSGSSKSDFKRVAQMGRLISTNQQVSKKTRTQRLVQKNGDCNITSQNVMKRNRKYLVDIFTTLVDMKWRYHLLLFAAAFVVTWFLFGIVWFTIAIGHKDDVYANNDTWHPCVDNVFDFKTALLFSIETQHTIGYGYRVIQAECHLAIVVMMVQSCLGLFIQSLITGIIFSKISRPKGRAQTIMFSQKAVICQRDGEYCLLFRVGDMRKSHIIGTSIRALLVKNRQTSEGESIPICQYPLTIETETSTDSFVFLIWPVTIVHKINSSSPLWELSPIGLVSDHFEVIVILEGTIESTGMLTQVRTSYIPAEIIWGERLIPLMTYQLNGHCEIDYTQFHNTTPMYMPDFSAKEYEEVKRQSTIQPAERDYPVSFTAPAIHMRQNRRSTVYGLFPRRPSKQTGTSLKVKSTNKSKLEQQSEKIKKGNKAQRNALEALDVTPLDGVGKRPLTSAAGDLIEFGGSLPSHQFKRHTGSANGNHSHIKAARGTAPSNGGQGSVTINEQGVPKA